MSRGILKTALTTNLRLNLTYRDGRWSNTERMDSEPSVSYTREIQSPPAHDQLFRMRWMYVGDVQ